MSEHHHHHHHMDGASKFKHKRLLAIERKKKLMKFLFFPLIVISILRFMAVVAAFTIGD